MCRFLAYFGQPILMDTLIATPCHSLIYQSMHAAEGKTEINGDGFGLGWYGEQEVPGLYRDVRPAWSDENLRSLASQVRSRLFFAHIRAATGTATTRANCHPFTHGRWMYMHNGQIGGWNRARRQIEGLIPDELYQHRAGTTDSEAIFLAAIGNGLDQDPMAAMSSTLKQVQQCMDQAGVTEPLRFTAMITNGETMWGFRWSSDARPPSLYYAETRAGFVVVSEPFDEERAQWREVPRGCSLVAHAGQAPVLDCMHDVLARAA